MAKELMASVSDNHKLNEICSLKDEQKALREEYRQLKLGKKEESYQLPKPDRLEIYNKILQQNTKKNQEEIKAKEKRHLQITQKIEDIESKRLTPLIYEMKQTIQYQSELKV